VNDGAKASAVIQAEQLTRRFGDLLAVDRVSFAVARGEVFGFLGPNGAGKTTTVRMITGVIAPSEGVARVCGHDVATHPVRARQHIGVVPEEGNVYLDLTVWQNVMLMGELHGVPRPQRVAEGERLLEAFGLAERRQARARALSKGLRQRLMLCTALVSRPRVLFLDEPTSGLDVASARLIREIVSDMNERGLTVFLTTHNMAEAEQMCDRVAIINHGRIVAVDSPDAMRDVIRSSRSVVVSFAGGIEAAPEALTELEGVSECGVSSEGHVLYTEEPGLVATRVVHMAEARGLRIQSIQTREPTLEDVFLHLTDTATKGVPND